MASTPISITINKRLLTKIDTYLDNIGSGANRSAFFSEASTYYLKIRLGIKEIFEK